MSERWIGERANFETMGKEKQVPKAKPKYDVAIVADVHLGNHRGWGGPVGTDGLNEAARLGVESLVEAIEIAKSAGCSVLIVAGDLFQTARPEPALIAAVQHAITAGELAVVLIPGNHDMPDATAENGNTALAPLWDCAQIVGSPERMVLSTFAIVAVPFDARAPMRKVLDECPLLEKPNADESRRTILVTHVGVYDDSDAKSSPWVRLAKDGISDTEMFAIMKRAGIRLAFVGNFHEHRQWTDPDGRTIIQCGTLAPHSFSDAGTHQRGLVILTDGEMIKTSEARGVRFVNLRGNDPNHLASLTHGISKGNRYVVRQTGGARWEESEIKELLAYEWVPEKAPTEKASGGPAPTSAPDPMAALTAHLAAAQMPPELDSTVARASVLALVKDFWKRSA
jgi:DNA repair exonuclease SbcCD nuclease subunit